MLKKRLIGVITVKSGRAVQSFGYRRYLPLGRPEILAENLDRWGADEIIVQCIDRSKEQSGPDLQLLDRIARMGLSTPLIYAGGIRSEEDGRRVIQTGADRIAIDALLHDAPKEVERLSHRLGAQALIAVLPLSNVQGSLAWYDHRHHHSTPLNSEVLTLLNSGTLSEAMIVDYEHEGAAGGFDASLLKNLPFKNTPLIAFGGISEAEQMEKLLGESRVVGVAVGNFLSYREHAVRHLKHQLSGLPLRKTS